MDIDMSLDDMAARDKKPARQAQGRPSQQQRSGRAGPQRTASGSGRTPYDRPPPASTESTWKHDMYGARPSSHSSGGRAGSYTGARGAGGEYTSSHPTARLKIENVHYEIQPFQLEKIFAQAGQLVDGPKIIYDRAGRSTGIAFVTYGSVSDARLAKEKLDGQKANGEPITITYVPVPLPSRTEGRVDDRGRAVAQVDNSGKSLLGRLGGILGDRPAPREREAGARGERRPPPAARAPSAPRTRGAPAARGRGAGKATEGGRGSRRAEPKTGDALDQELEAFMNAPAGAAKAAESTATAMEE